MAYNFWKNVIANLATENHKKILEKTSPMGSLK